MAGAEYLEDRPDVGSTSRWSQYGYVSDQLRTTIRRLLSRVPLEDDATVLDYGCADRPYRDLLPRRITYLAADLPGNPHAELELVDGLVPQPDASCDLVLSTQVLEHVERPDRYLDECHRLLRPGGSLVLSTHGVMYYHRDPEDYWRWTLPGLTRVLADHGFRVDEAHGVLGLAAAALQIFQDATMWKVPRRLHRLYARLMQIAIAFTDRRYAPSTRLENCLTLAVRATKRNVPTHA
jgi:SAM-dependent methyltransferase